MQQPWGGVTGGSWEPPQIALWLVLALCLPEGRGTRGQRAGSPFLCTAHPELGVGGLGKLRPHPGLWPWGCDLQQAPFKVPLWKR